MWVGYFCPTLLALLLILHQEGNGFKLPPRAKLKGAEKARQHQHGFARAPPKILSIAKLKLFRVTRCFYAPNKPSSYVAFTLPM
jgi:hypothetical protein